MYHRTHPGHTQEAVAPQAGVNVGSIKHLSLNLMLSSQAREHSFPNPFKRSYAFPRRLETLPFLTPPLSRNSITSLDYNTDNIPGDGPSIIQ